VLWSDRSAGWISMTGLPAEAETAGRMEHSDTEAGTPCKPTPQDKRAASTGEMLCNTLNTASSSARTTTQPAASTALNHRSSTTATVA
jgi:hypothetical protein